MSRNDPEFYVNYFPVPARLRRFLWRIAPLIASTLAVIAAGAALAMRHPGHGRWSADEVALEGVVLDDPWPVLRVETDTGWRSILLVEFGKLGADRAIRQAGVAGRRARIHGTVIQRDDRQVLELAPRPGAIEDLGPAGAVPAALNVTALGTLEIEGEIVDPKCYLGAMQPGQGAVHRACARVCIAGGIPAGLIAPGAPTTNGAPAPDRFLLLLHDDGTPLGPRSLEWVGTPVRIRGQLERWSDLLVLKVQAIAPITRAAVGP